MKVTKLLIYPDVPVPVPVSLNFRDPMGIEPYTVKSILGLDAEDINSQYYSTSENFNASKLFNMVLQPRTIVVKVGLNPDFSAGRSNSDLRDNLYRLISASRTGKLRLVFMDVIDEAAEIFGFVTKFESPLFEQTQEIQITIRCEDPMLRRPLEVDYPLVGLDPAFTIVTDNLSTAPHGVIMFLDIKKNISRVRITDPSYPDDWNFTVTPITGFQANDIFLFYSDPLQRLINVVRGGNFINIADAIQPGSNWPIMFPGDNRYSFEDPTGFDWRSIAYFPTYWGV